MKWMGRELSGEVKRWAGLGLIGLGEESGRKKREGGLVSTSTRGFEGVRGRVSVCVCMCFWGFSMSW